VPPRSGSAVSESSRMARIPGKWELGWRSGPLPLHLQTPITLSLADNDFMNVN